MPSSSLFLRSSTTFITSLLFSTAFAAPHAKRVSSAAEPTYTLAHNYAGSNFYDQFDFFHDSDPTHGFVQYNDRAGSQNLIGFEGDYAVWGVDDTTVISDDDYNHYNNQDGSFTGRQSIRLEGKDSFTHGLVISDIKQMPGGLCGTWPAFWTLGTGSKGWPYYGEIDIIEGSK